MIARPRWPLACVCVLALTVVGCGRSRDRARAADSTITVLYPGFDERALGEFWTHPVGNGPYRYVRHVPKTMLEVEANPDYYRGKPKIERVVLKFGTLGGLTELLSGNVDVAPVDGTDLLKIAGDRRYQAYYDLGTNDISALILNHRPAPFGDSKVRRALTLAINRRDLLQVLNLPPKLPTFDVIFTPRQFWRGELPDPLPYDPELAKRLLEEAGWRDTDGDDVRDHSGKPFRFAALVRPAQGQDKAAVYIQDQLRRVGVQMEVQTLERMRARLLGGKFEAAIYLTNFSGRLGHLKFFGDDSPIGYANGTVSALLKEAWTTQNLDADERRKMDAIYRRLMPIFQAELPLIYLYPACFYSAAHRRVHGLSSPHRADPVWHMEDLWLEDRSGP